MDTFNYKNNIKALRAGTALNNEVFIDTIRERYNEELGGDNIFLFVDPSIFIDSDFEKVNYIETNLDGEELITKQYPASTVNILEENITEQYKAITGKQFEMVDKNGITNPFQKALDELNHKDLQQFVLEGVDKNRATAHSVDFEGSNATIITIQETDSKFLDELCAGTGWNSEDVKYTGNTNPSFALNVADHEMGHGVLYKHLNGQKPLPENITENKKYNRYIHECFADSFSALYSIHDGEEKEIFDLLCLDRAYGAIINNDSDHFTNDTLQHLKNHIDVDYIRNMDSKKEVAEHCLKVVLGDEELGLDPAYLNEDAFERQSENIGTLHAACNNYRKQTGFPTLTPLQFKETVKAMPETFSDGEIKLLQQHVIPLSKVMSHKNDVDLELMTGEEFENHKAKLTHEDLYNLKREKRILEKSEGNCSAINSEIKSIEADLNEAYEHGSIHPDDKARHIIKAYKQEDDIDHSFYQEL